MSNCEHCSELNKVTKDKFAGINLQLACYIHKDVILNGKKMTPYRS